jgi:hypothetical protein
MIRRPLVPYGSAFEASSQMLSREDRRLVVREVIGPILKRLLLDRKCLVKVSDDFGHIEDIQRAHSDRMLLFPLANPAVQPDMKPENSFVLVVEYDGEPVACAGARLKRINGTLASELESLRVLYAEPAQKLPGERWEVESSLLERIGGTTICWLVGGWKDKRIEEEIKNPEDLIVFKAVMRLLDAWVVCCWGGYTDVIGLGEDKIARHYAFQIEGFTDISLGVRQVTPTLPPYERFYRVLHTTPSRLLRIITDERFGKLNLDLSRLHWPALDSTPRLVQTAVA